MHTKSFYPAGLFGKWLVEHWKKSDVRGDLVESFRISTSSPGAASVRPAVTCTWKVVSTGQLTSYELMAPLEKNW